MAALPLPKETTIASDFNIFLETGNSKIFQGKFFSKFRENIHINRNFSQN